MLKKVILLVMIVGIAGVLFAKEHEAKKEDSPFMKYYKNQTDGNFIEAYNYYMPLMNDKEKGEDAKINFMYIHTIAAEGIIDMLKKDFDNLSPRSKFSLANMLMEKGELDEAVAYYEKINKDMPNWSCPWRHKGEALFKQKKLKDAEISLKQAIETRKEHYDAYIMLADVQKELKKYAEALKTFETGISYKGKDIEDPEEEVRPTDEMFLHIELLKLNGKDYSEVEKKLKKIAPDDDRWKKF